MPLEDPDLNSITRSINTIYFEGHCRWKSCRFSWAPHLMPEKAPPVSSIFLPIDFIGNDP